LPTKSVIFGQVKKYLGKKFAPKLFFYYGYDVIYIHFSNLRIGYLDFAICGLCASVARYPMIVCWFRSCVGQEAVKVFNDLQVGLPSAVPVYSLLPSYADIFITCSAICSFLFQWS